MVELASDWYFYIPIGCQLSHDTPRQTSIVEFSLVTASRRDWLFMLWHVNDNFAVVMLRPFLAVTESMLTSCLVFRQASFLLHRRSAVFLICSRSTDFTWYFSNKMIFFLKYVHWNKNVVILTKFSSLAALEVVILTTSSAASDEHFIKMKTFPFQCYLWFADNVTIHCDNTWWIRKLKPYRLRGHNRLGGHIGMGQLYV